MFFMVIERYRNGNAKAVYERLSERGRMMPDDLRYVASWVESTLDRCFQVMECDDERALHAWIDAWKDLVDFEIIPVVTSEAARQRALLDE